MKSLKEKKIYSINRKMSVTMDTPISIIMEKALLYEEKMKKNCQFVKNAYYKRMAREKGITVEEYMSKGIKRGRPKKQKPIEAIES